MNNISKSSLLMLALFALNGQAMAGYQSDAAALDGAVGTGTSNAITTFKGDVDKYSPPAPCVDTSGYNGSTPIAFTLGSPAQLSCGGSAASGGSSSGGASSGGSSNSGSSSGSDLLLN